MEDAVGIAAHICDEHWDWDQFLSGEPEMVDEDGEGRGGEECAESDERGRCGVRVEGHQEGCQVRVGDLGSEPLHRDVVPQGQIRKATAMARFPCRVAPDHAATSRYRCHYRLRHRSIPGCRL